VLEYYSQIWIGDGKLMGTGMVVGDGGSGDGVRGITGGGSGLPAPSSPAGVSADAKNGFGVFARSDVGAAVYGVSGSQAGVGGESTGFDGVYGATHSASHAGVSGHAQGGPGVFGDSKSGVGVQGSSVSGRGVWGSSIGASGVCGQSANNDGVYGESHTAGSAGVNGTSQSGTGVFGKSTDGEGVHGETTSTVHPAVVGVQFNAASTGAGVYGEHKGTGIGVFGKSVDGEAVHGETTSASHPAVVGIQYNPNSTGAGVYGEHKGNGPAGYFKGDVIVTGDVVLVGADCAEQFEVTGDAFPGAVMVFDDSERLLLCTEPYDRRVAGVISGANSYRPGIILNGREPAADRCPIALIGRVFCKVDASFGAIQAGDLLTTSPNPGHAMKADDSSKAFGATLGKALRPLSEGKDLIPILVALQ
jgi:hypothetical protein